MMLTTKNSDTLLTTALHNIRSAVVLQQTDWVEGTVSLCLCLNEARALFPSSQDLYKWLSENGVDVNRYHAAAALAMAQDPEKARSIIARTKRRSLEMIHAKEFKPKAVRKPKLQTDKRGRAAGVDIRTSIEAWDQFRALAEGEGKTPQAKLNEIVAATANMDLAAPASFSRTKQEEFDRSLNAHKRVLDLRFKLSVEQEVKRLLDEMILPTWNKRKAELDLVMKSRKGLFTRKQYNDIMRCLHPDTQPTEQQKTIAFRLIAEQKLVLLSEKEQPSEPWDLPKTAAELLARRRK